jgi:hypothetical protein
MIRTWRWVVLALALPLAVAAAEKVTESDYAKLRKLQYAKALVNVREEWSHGDKAKQAQAKAGWEQALKETGWNDDTFSRADEAVGEVMGNLQSNKSGDLSDDDLKQTLAESDPTTVATVRAHYAELSNSKDSSQAEQQVRDEIQQEAAGVPPTRAQLEGTWVFDSDATIDAMLGGLATAEDKAKMKADMLAKVGTSEFTFGPGDLIISRTRDSAGGEKVDRAAYRLDGRKVFIKGGESRREYDLTIGLRNGRLQLGMGGLGFSVFSRK